MPLGVEGGPSLWAPFWLKANWCISGFLLHPWPCSRMWPADLGPYTSLAECRRFFGVDDGLWAAWVASAGDPQDDYRVMAPIPPAAMAAVSEAALLPNGDPLTVTQAAQLGLVYRLARRVWRVKNWLDLIHWVDPGPWNPTGGVMPPTTSTPGSGSTSPPVGERKMKYASVLDQADETEFVIAPETQRQVCLETYIRKVGGLPRSRRRNSCQR